MLALNTSTLNTILLVLAVVPMGVSLAVQLFRAGARRGQDKERDIDVDRRLHRLEISTGVWNNRRSPSSRKENGD